MATEVTLPELGDGIESGDVLEIFVSVGDQVNVGDYIVEMETDKATVPIDAKVAGKIVKIAVAEGDSVPVGGVLVEIEVSEGSTVPVAPEPSPEPQAAPEPPPTPPSQPVQHSPPPAPAPPTPVHQPPPQPEVREPVSVPTPTDPGVIPAGPAVRRFAREVGVDLSGVPGTGDGGRITRDDVLAVVRSASQARTSASTASQQSTTGSSAAVAPRPGTAASDDFGPVSVERMSKIRKTISRQMHASWSTVPRVTNFDDADITDLERLRQSSKEDYAAQGLKLTTMPFLIKAVATALKHHPTINAVIDEENEQVIYKEYVNVGIAVDTDRGLVVPVMNAADRMGVPEITRSLAEMAGKVRGGKFGVNDLKGGTFTISNLGAIGGQYSTPIVNVPEVAILLVGRSRKLPVVMPDDSIQPRLMMPLSLSYDHRLVDGGTAARFLNDVIGYLEAPSRLLLAL